MANDLGLRDAAWVAEALNLETEEVEGLMRRKELPGFPLGSKWFVAESSLRDFLKAKEAAGIGPSRHGPGPAARPIVRRRRKGTVSYRLLGKSVENATFKAMLLDVLRTLANRDPRFLDRFSQERGRNRRYVARERSQLYSGKPGLVRDASEELVAGWWVGTNYSASQVQSIIEKACRIAGLQWGRDLFIQTPDEEERIKRAMSWVGIASDPDPEASIHHDEHFADSILHPEDDSE
jgi:hypothetical protein